MGWGIRIVCIFGVLLLAGGVVAAAFWVGFTCFDTCPPNLAAATSRGIVLSLLPGFVVAGLGWTYVFRRLRHLGRHRRADILLIALPICVLGSALIMLSANGGHILPVTEGEITPWERALTIPIFLLPCWPLITLLCTFRLPREARPVSADMPAMHE